MSVGDELQYQIYPGHPLTGTLLTSVGDNERKRIVRHYFPEGDPGEMMQQMTFARKYGLAVPPYLARAGRMYKLWFASPGSRIGLVIAGVLIVGAIAYLIRKKKS